MVNETRKCQNRDSQRRFRERQRQRAQQEREAEHRNDGQHAQSVDPHQLTAPGSNTGPGADASNSGSNATSTDLEGPEHDGADDFTRFLNAQEAPSRVMDWQESADDLFGAGPAPTASIDEDEDGAALLHEPFEESIAVSRGPMTAADPLARASTHLKPLSFRDMASGGQYLTPQSIAHGTRPGTELASQYGDVTSPRKSLRAQSHRLRTPTQTQPYRMVSNKPRAASASSYHARPVRNMADPLAFSRQLQQLLQTTSQVYEVGVLMGTLEEDPSLRHSINWMRQRVDSAVAEPKHIED